MTLTTATLLVGLFLILLGICFLLSGAGLHDIVRKFPRSRIAGYILFAIGALWFLYKIWHLSEADFGEYRHWIFAGFAAVGILTFWVLPDFLAVRGAAVIVLLAASPLLDTAYMRYEIPQRLLMVSALYILIALAIYLGAVPYRLRDFINWLYTQKTRARIFGAFLALYGIALLITSATY